MWYKLVIKNIFNLKNCKLKTFQCTSIAHDLKSIWQGIPETYGVNKHLPLR